MGDPTRAGLADYLQPSRFVDSDHPRIIAFARELAAPHNTDRQRAVALYYAVRDRIRYDPFRLDLTPEAMRASTVLEREYGFCVAKAVLLAAAARVLGIPSRLGFADVRNHLTTPRLRRLMSTDLFAFHGYAELYINDCWVKATPAFNRSLCERFDVEPLAFDGEHDALLQQADRKGNRYMEYVRDRGNFVDLPLDELRGVFEEHYPTLLAHGAVEHAANFEHDAAREGDTSCES